MLNNLQGLLYGYENKNSNEVELRTENYNQFTSINSISLLLAISDYGVIDYLVIELDNEKKCKLFFTKGLTLMMFCTF